MRGLPSREILGIPVVSGLSRTQVRLKADTTRVCVVRSRVFDVHADRIGERPQDVGHETAITAAKRKAAPDFVGAHHRAALDVDDDHVAGAQAAAVDDLVLVGRKDADLGRDRNQVVAGRDDARRSEAVAIERGADVAAVGEDEGRRTVPRLADQRLEFVEGAHVGRHRAIPLPGRRHEARDGVGQRVAVMPQQFDRVVERQRVGTVRRDRRFQAEAGQRRRIGGAGMHPAAISRDRVDFPVVREGAERLRQRPVGRGVRAESLVERDERRHESLVGQIRIEAVERVRGDERLVDERPRRKRDDGQADAGGPRSPLDPQARAIKRGVGGLAAVVEAGKDLQHLRRGVALRAQHRGALGRHDAPVNRACAGVAELPLDDFARVQAVAGMDEQHAEPARARRRQPVPEGLDDPGPRDGGQDAAAIDRAERGFRAAMGQPAQRRQAVRDDVAAGSSAQMSDEADAAGVMVGGGLGARIHVHVFMRRDV